MLNSYPPSGFMDLCMLTWMALVNSMSGVDAREQNDFIKCWNSDNSTTRHLLHSVDSGIHWCRVVVSCIIKKETRLRSFLLLLQLKGKFIPVSSNCGLLGLYWNTRSFNKQGMGAEWAHNLVHQFQLDRHWLHTLHFFCTILTVRFVTSIRSPSFARFN